MESNPFAPPDLIEETDRGVYGDHARCLRKTLLYREIRFDGSIEGLFIYDGWWFRQKITLNGNSVWFRISWLNIHRNAAFDLPTSIDPLQRRCRVEIEFSQFLLIRRFRVWLDGETLYDEIA